MYLSNPSKFKSENLWTALKLVETDRTYNNNEATVDIIQASCDSCSHKCS